ncbi:3'(2'),5'-bisphosphate nucleotidase CysQ [Novacetimonas hansenii]|uniref:3'(2'),5'-bisphosphate nucleotidase CysQ n=1 Tax=Novacetimonas hansenii TaxID=436 RepID=UPI000789B7D7|nr:3'(2'),5'-bisphosphate nucleotidase CysQ [Novacetimonas hansenii]RFO99032.1 3'(2'),5'-bisphosphate nucleotidase [Novacetimonas hansenii]WEQ58975.1 3'(2'),5'-bisphosphate nucleotidase CysQ [Novacetimonas hansenii]CUW47521.1 3'(2'),5'-bisphosphate nucleotidase CysQ [Novacetimonas hansenii]
MNIPSLHAPDDQALLDLAVRLATEAAALIRDIRARGFVTHTKTDDSPVTEADHAAEAHILAGLRAAAPSIPVIAEEEAAAGIKVETDRTYWLVDPLDGTREFAAGREDFTVNIGLVRDHRAVLGAVALPAYHQVYAGRVGHGAWRRDANGQHAIHTRTPPVAGLDVLASRHYADDPRLKALLAQQPVASIRNIGSAAKFIRVAEGIADLYPRLGPTMEWDTAAPQAVLEAAGGSITEFDGTPLAYGKARWRNPPFICRGAQ